MSITLKDSFQFENGLTTRNRVVLAPMTLSVCESGGYVSNDDIAFYKRRSKSVGMVITGSAYIHPYGQAFANSYSVADDDKIEGLSHLAKTIKDEGSLAILQIYHGGRMVPPTLIDVQPLAPSAVIGQHGHVVEPRALKNHEIEELISQFLDAIRRAIKAGFDGIELHGANTYLIQQFCSPHSNIRTDKWGGTLNNRMRFSKTLLKKAKQLVKKETDRPFLVGYRFSPEEIENPGIELYDSLQLIEQLIRLGVDYLHISSSNVWRPSLRNPQQKDLVIDQVIRKVDKRVPLIAVGNIQTYEDSQMVLDKEIPLFSVGRSLLLEPDWTQKVIEGRDAEIVRQYRDDLQDYLQLPTAFVESMRDYLEGNY